MRPNALLIHGDGRHLPLRDESVQCVVCSPPYWGLRDYGLDPLVWGGEAGCGHEWNVVVPPVEKAHNSDETYVEKQASNAGALRVVPGSSFCSRCSAWRGSLGLEPTPDLYVQHLVGIFREVRRVLRKDGTCWVNLGDSYAANRSYQVPSTKGGPKHSPAQGFDGSGMSVPMGLKPKDLIGLPWRVAFALQADGWWLRSDVIWAKPNPMPESVTDRPTKAHEYVFLLTKSERYFYDAEAVSEPGEMKPQQRFTNGKGPKSDGYASHRQPTGMTKCFSRNLRSVWTIATEPFPEAHFATFPSKLVETCVKAGTSERGACAACGAPWERIVERQIPFDPGRGDSKLRDADGLSARAASTAQRRLGQTYQDQLDENPPKTVGWRPTCECGTKELYPCLVLDPFSGSGTVPMVAQELGRVGIGVELKPQYLAMAKKRTAQGVML